MSKHKTSLLEKRGYLIFKKKHVYMAPLQKKTSLGKRGCCEAKIHEKEIHEDINGFKWDKRKHAHTV